jgi:RHS repeat-associated protein
LKVTHSKTNIIQYNEYYPFGLQSDASWTRKEAVENDYLFNSGSELNTTIGWYETGTRNYDPSLGRFMAVDPMAAKYSSVSAYHYSGNNPVMLTDPTGADYWNGYGYEAMSPNYGWGYGPSYWGDYGYQQPFDSFNPNGYYPGGYYPGGYPGGMNWDPGSMLGPGGESNPFYSDGWNPNPVGGFGFGGGPPIIAVCPTCPPGPEWDPFRDSPNYYEYDPTTNTAVLVTMLPEVTVTANKTTGATTVSIVIFYQAFTGEATGSVLSTSNTFAGFSMVSDVTESALRNDLKYVKNVDKIDDIGKAASKLKFATGALAILSVVAETVEDASDEEGFTWGDGAKLLVGGGVAIAAIAGSPFVITGAAIYGLVDFGLEMTTGAGLTDRIGAGVDALVK